MSDHHLLRRKNGVYYYRRRVPLHLVEKFGVKIVQLSLHTRDLKEAKKRRTLRDVEWDAKSAACSSPPNGGAAPAVQTSALAQPLSETGLIQLVRDYVARQDQLARKRDVTDYPENPTQRAEMRIEAEVESQILTSRDHPQAQQWNLHRRPGSPKACRRIVEGPGHSGRGACRASSPGAARTHPPTACTAC